MFFDVPIVHVKRGSKTNRFSGWSTTISPPNGDVSPAWKKLLNYKMKIQIPRSNEEKTDKFLT